jgi:hypothetical protein
VQAHVSVSAEEHPYALEAEEVASCWFQASFSPQGRPVNSVATHDAYDSSARESTVLRIRRSRTVMSDTWYLHAGREGDVGEIAVGGCLRSVRVAEGDACVPDHAALS